MKQLLTKWGRDFHKESVLLEYPRPQLKRNSYVNLNGEWQCAFTGAGVKNPADVKFHQNIIVPYSPESFLSGVRRQLKPDELLWYRRIVTLPSDFTDENRLLLHFGAVDQMCRIYVNREPAGKHAGGYLPFYIDLTDYVNYKDKTFELIVAVRDKSETAFHSRGKQLLKRGGMFYTAQSGIWQTVWLECAPKRYIRTYQITPDIITGEVRMEIAFNESIPRSAVGNKFKIEVRKPYIDPLSESHAEECKEDSAYEAEKFRDKDYESLGMLDGFQENNKLEGIVVSADDNTAELRFTVTDRRLWSPVSPYLYYFRLTAFDDEVLGYFAFRKFSIERQDTGRIDQEGFPRDLLDTLSDELKNHPRICLNDTPYFQNGVLDQGYFPEGLYTAPGDLAYLYDILKMKDLGFNMLRKHLKIEPDRFYYHCDRIGMTVWQDMVNGGSPYKFWFVTYVATAFNMVRYRIFDNCYRLLGRSDKAGRREFEREMIATAKLLYNHPSISTWVIFNEGWGQFDAKRMTKKLRLTDPTRLIDAASGWFDQSCGDLRSQHYYFMKLNIQWCLHRATVLSEYGGFPCRIEGHAASEKVYGYHNCKTLRELNARYTKLMEQTIEPEIRRGLSATVYTQLSDIEDEVNGILTYDREICKLKPR